MHSDYAVYACGLFLAAGILGVGASLAFAQEKPSIRVPQVALSAEAPFLAENDTAMNKMMTDMAVKPTGDTDHDFVAMMIPHHQGAIDMAQAELRYGHNEQLIRVAQGVIVEQLQEIAAMRLAIDEPASPTWVADARPSAPRVHSISDDSVRSEAPYLAQNDTAMNKMMAGMAVKPTGNVDHDFAAMMIPHHQGAIDMAQAELRYGKNAQVKLISQEIIVDQIQEIFLMRLALGEPLPPAISSPTQTPEVPGGPPTPMPRASTKMSPNVENSMQTGGMNMTPTMSPNTGQK